MPLLVGTLYRSVLLSYCMQFIRRVQNLCYRVQLWVSITGQFQEQRNLYFGVGQLQVNRSLLLVTLVPEDGLLIQPITFVKVAIATYLT